jgi:hypothetical protein
MEAFVSVTEFPDYIREKKTATHDGMIWPVARRDMRTTRAIRERMAEDLAALVKNRGVEAVILTDDFLAMGWTREQINSHMLAASQHLATENDCGTDPAGDRARDLANEVA